MSPTLGDFPLRQVLRLQINCGPDGKREMHLNILLLPPVGAVSPSRTTL